MRWNIIILALLLVSTLALAGRFESVGTIPRVVMEHPIDDQTITQPQYTAPCGRSGGAAFAATDGRVRCYVPDGWNLLVTHVSGTATEDVNGAGSGNCHYTLAHNTSGTTGTDLTDSDIYFDEAFDCDGTPKDITNQGESCMRRTAPLLLLAGSWAHWKLADGNDGTCQTTDTYMRVYGDWIKTG